MRPHVDPADYLRNHVSEVFRQLSFAYGEVQDAFGILLIASEEGRASEAETRRLREAVERFCATAQQGAQIAIALAHKMEREEVKTHGRGDV